jgi:hypothetical protein
MRKFLLSFVGALAFQCSFYGSQALSQEVSQENLAAMERLAKEGFGVLGEAQFGRENAQFLGKWGSNKGVMTLLCGCGQAWSKFTQMHYRFPNHIPNTSKVNNFSDNVFRGDTEWYDRVKFIFSGNYEIEGQVMNTNFPVLGNAVNTQMACLPLEKQGARLAHEMVFREDKPGINSLRDICSVRWPYQ